MLLSAATERLADEPVEPTDAEAPRPDRAPVVNSADVLVVDAPVFIADWVTAAAPTVPSAVEPTPALRSDGDPICWELDCGTLYGVADGRPIITVSINEDTGEYTVELTGPIDHPNRWAEDVKNLRIPVNVSDGELETCTTLTVKIEDDSPRAADVNVNAVAGAVTLASVNIVIVLDVSGSMGIADSGEISRLDLAKSALDNLLHTQNAVVNQVMVVTFSSGADVYPGTGNHWTDATSASVFIRGLEPNGGTNYTDAVSTVMNSWGSGETGPTQADKTLVYFISDGEPTDGQALDDPNAVTTATWESFLAGEHVSVAYAIGVSPNIDDTNLRPISWTLADPELSPINLTDANGLDATLQGTVPDAPTHNIFTDTESTVGFGGDGGRIYSVSVDGYDYIWDGYSWITKIGPNTDEQIPGSSINVTTALGGTFKFAFADGGDGADYHAGDWTYTPPASLVAPADEVFHYILTDNDGDKAGADITVSVTANNYLPTVDLDSTQEGTGYVSTVTNDDRPLTVFSDHVVVSDFDSALLQSASIRLDYLGGVPGNYIESASWTERFSIDESALPGLTTQPGDIVTHTLNTFGGLQWQVTSGASGLFLNITGEANAATYAELLNAVRFSSHSTNLADREISVTVSDGTNDSTVANAIVHLETPADQRPPGELVVNGGFEMNLLDGTGAKKFSGWTLANATGNESGSDGPQHSGDYDAALHSNDPEPVTLSQIISTTEDTHYTLSFWLRNVDFANDFGQPDNSFSATWNGLEVLSLTDARSSNVFTHYVFEVVGTADDSVLQFAGYNPTDYWRIDDVSLREGAPANQAPVFDASGIAASFGPFSVTASGVTLSDADAGNDMLTGSVTAEYGFVGLAGGNVINVTGSGTGALSGHGTLADINDALADGIVYTPNLGSPTEKVTLAVDDGHGGTNSLTFVFAVTQTEGLLEGGSGKDVIVASAGNDTLTGHEGADTFVFGPYAGAANDDVVTDFSGRGDGDIVMLSGFNVANFDDLLLEDVTHESGAHDTVVHADQNAITLQNVNVSTLSAADFIFHPVNPPPVFET